VPVVTQKQCESAYPHRVVDNSMVCAGLPAGGMDGCQVGCHRSISYIGDFQRLWKKKIFNVFF